MTVRGEVARSASDARRAEQAGRARRSEAEVFGISNSALWSSYRSSHAFPASLARRAWLIVLIWPIWLFYYVHLNWLVWSVSFIWLNQTDQTNQMNQIDQINQTN
jgi:hypothetical protein